MQKTNENHKTPTSHSNHVNHEAKENIQPPKFWPLVLYLKDSNNKNKTNESASELYTYSVEEDRLYLTKVNDKKYNNFNTLYHRSVNVGNNTIMITGGSIRLSNSSSLIKTCYLLSWDYNENEGRNFTDIKGYNLFVRDYPQMNEERSRHNIIYLHDKSAVFVCSNIDKKPNITSEITYLNNEKKSWTLLKPLLRESRGNATMAYIDERYIYCISGFQYEGSKYLTSMEYIDSNSFDEYKFIDFKDNLLKTSLGGKCTMGVIHQKNNDFLIFGGFDGSNNYCKDVFEINFDNHDDIFCKKANITSLGDVNIFYTQNFLCIGGGKYVNFNLKCNKYFYDDKMKKFEISSDNIEFNYE